MAVGLAWLYTAVVLVSFFCYHTLSQPTDESTAIPGSSSSTFITGQTTVHNQSISAVPPSSPVLHLQVGATFCDSLEAFEGCVAEFNRSLSFPPDGSSKAEVILSPVALLPLSSAHLSILYTCNAVQHRNISVFAAVGKRDMINFLSIVTEDTGIPLLGYTTDLDSLSFKSDREMYVELNPGLSLLADAMSEVFIQNGWELCCLLVQHDYAMDVFVQAFKTVAHTAAWTLEYLMRFHTEESSLDIHYKILKLQENQCRIFILHASIDLARTIFKVAGQDGLLGQGFAWFLTDTAYTSSISKLSEFPTGAIAFRVNDPKDSKHLIAAIGSHLRENIIAFNRNHPGVLKVLNKEKNCFRNLSSSEKKLASLLEGYLENATYSAYHEQSAQNPLSSLRTVKLVNLVNAAHNTKKWRSVGSYTAGKLRTNAIIWPGETVAGPFDRGQRLLRVVTNIAPPFVMEHEATAGNCSRSVPCLRVYTKDKETLDNIFDDYAKGLNDSSRPYEVHCCQGLSVNLLESLAIDLNFNVHLYITSDHKYGNYHNGSWSGIVQDLTLGLAHMAVAPFSITHKRSSVIDFSHPYYYSGFAILVSEKKRQIPIYAFTEPFDKWIWISVVISATLVAVVLAVFEWKSPFGLNPWGRKRKSNYTLGSGLNMVYAILFGHTVKTKSPKAWPSKWLQNFWAGASIFIYSSYTANLAAFLAGKNSDVTVSGIHDTRLLEPGKQVGIIRGTAVEDYVQEVNSRMLIKAKKYNATLPIETAMALLIDSTIDAYLDDSPILEYARETMDATCSLRLVNNGFGEDSYGIGLPKDSWLKGILDKTIMKYHQNGYIEELIERYFSHSRCKNRLTDELQDEGDRMEFNQHAGLYVLLAVGIFLCVMLMLLEHATFKWLVPYWRRKPKDSFWKSMSMMFWSQRLHRIITSEELVSPHHSAREMIEVVKNRDFTKLFQKSVKKQEKLVRNRKNLFNVVEQLQWKQLKDELLSKQPSLQEQESIDSDREPPGTSSILCNNIQGAQSKTAMLCNSLKNLQQYCVNHPMAPGTPSDHSSNPLERDASLTSPGHTNPNTPRLKRQKWLAGSNTSLNSLHLLTREEEDDDEDNAQSIEVSVTPHCKNCDQVSFSSAEDLSRDDKETSPTVNEWTPLFSDLLTARSRDSDRRFSSTDIPSLSLDNTDYLDEDDYLTYSLLPNGMVILSPEASLLSTTSNVTTGNNSGKSHLLRPHPKHWAHLQQTHSSSNNSPEPTQTRDWLATQDNRVKCAPINRSHTLECLNVGGVAGGEGHKLGKQPKRVNLGKISKEELYTMWRVSERELHRKLRALTHEKQALEKQVHQLKQDT